MLAGMMPTSLPTVLAVFAALCLLLAIAQLRGARRRWRERRRFSAAHHTLWSLVFLLLALLGALGGLGLVGWHRLTAEALVATIEAHRLAPQRYAVAVTTPDGTRRDVEIDGDDWQLDARIVKWTPRAVVLGAPPLYRLDRIGGRWHDVEQARSGPHSVHALGRPGLIDPFPLLRQMPQRVALVDADYGGSAWLPLVDGGRYAVTLAAGGGLVARPADAATVDALRADGWLVP